MHTQNFCEQVLVATSYLCCHWQPWCNPVWLTGLKTSTNCCDSVHTSMYRFCGNDLRRKQSPQISRQNRDFFPFLLVLTLSATCSVWLQCRWNYNNRTKQHNRFQFFFSLTHSFRSVNSQPDLCAIKSDFKWNSGILSIEHASTISYIPTWMIRDLLTTKSSMQHTVHHCIMV